MKVIIPLIICLLYAPKIAHTQQTFKVSSSEEVERLLDSGKVAAGDTIAWTKGEYNDVALNVEGVDGSLSKPITLKAETPGSVVFPGKSQFKIGAANWTIKGFHFDGSEDESNAYNTFQFRSNGGRAARNVTLANCAFTNLKTEKETSKWVLIFGQSNAIENCHFSGKNSKGALVTVELGCLGDGETADHLITRNYFGDFLPQAGNDNETIRIGSSEDQHKPASCVVRDNYFFRCDGEPEIISSKSSYNSFERNTLRQCNGSLVLRHGHHTRVEGNFFIGDGAADAGGIRVVDSHHLIVNNYFQDLTGTKWNAAFSILGGDENSGGSSNGYQAVDEITVVHNSFFNCKRSIFLNNTKGSRAPTGLIANNLISSSHGPLIKDDLDTTKLKWLGNVFHGASVGADIQSVNADLKLREINGLIRPDKASPAADSAVQCNVRVERDIFGQIRPAFSADVGAEEVSGANGTKAFGPLTPDDVGVSFDIPLVPHKNSADVN